MSLTKFFQIQKVILPLINNPIARRVLGVPQGKRIVRISNNSIHWQENRVQNKAIFYGSPVFKNKGRKIMEAGVFSSMLLALGISKDLVLPLIALPIFYPDADPENTSVDGYVAGGWAAGLSFANIRDRPGNNSNDSGADMYTFLKAHADNNEFETLRRLVILFDTSTIGAATVIASAVLSLYPTSKTNTLLLSAAHAGHALVSSNPTANDALQNADFAIARFGNTRYITDLAYADITVDQYNDMTLNAAGKNAIAKTGITKFGMMLAVDLDNGTPNWVAGAKYCLVIFKAADGGAATKPKLEVTYAAGGTHLKTMGAQGGL